MASIPVVQKTKGRPSTGQDPVSSIRLSGALRAAIDAYADRQPDPKPSRSEMIRKILEDRLVHEGLIEPGPEVGTRT